MNFIIKTGYSDNDFIKINSLEDLERAQAAFLTNSKTIFSNGQACRGQDIISLREDWHAEMGWNPTHEMGDGDWNELKSKGVEKKYKGVLSEVKNRVQYFIDTKQTHLIGKNADVPAIEKPKEISEGVRALASKFSI